MTMINTVPLKVIVIITKGTPFGINRIKLRNKKQRYISKWEAEKRLMML